MTGARRAAGSIGLLSLLLALKPAWADTSGVTSSGFTSSFRAEIKTTPAQTWTHGPAAACANAGATQPVPAIRFSMRKWCWRKKGACCASVAAWGRSRAGQAGEPG